MITFALKAIMSYQLVLYSKLGATFIVFIVEANGPCVCAWVSRTSLEKKELEPSACMLIFFAHYFVGYSRSPVTAVQVATVV